MPMVALGDVSACAHAIDAIAYAYSIAKNGRVIMLEKHLGHGDARVDDLEQSGVLHRSCPLSPVRKRIVRHW